MPNGKYILNDLQFDKEIKEMPVRELLEYTAKLSYSNAIRITSLESSKKKTSGVVGGASGLIAAAIVAMIDYFMRR